MRPGLDHIAPGSRPNPARSTPPTSQGSSNTASLLESALHEKMTVLVRAELEDNVSMTKAPRKYRGVDLAGREKMFGKIYVWLYRRHDGFARELSAGTHGFWAAKAREMANDGIRSKLGRPPTGNAVGKAWLVVSRHHPEDAERYAAAREANTGHVSRRHKGWVPTSPEPLPPVGPAVSLPSRELPGTSAPIPRNQPRPDGHVPHASTVSINHLAGDDPLANLTPEEAVALAPLEGAPRESILSMLNVIRRFAHMDRHNKPPK